MSRPAGVLAAIVLTATAFGTTAARAAPPTTAPVVPAPPARVRAVETLLYAIPPGVRVADTVASPDQRHVACVEAVAKDADDAPRDRRYAVVVDGQRGKPYEWVVGNSLTFSPDAGRYAFLVAQGQHVFAVVGTSPGAGDAAGSGAMAEPVEGKAYFSAGRVVFSPDGRRWAHRARPARGGPVVMVVDGVEGPESDAPPNPGAERADDAETAFSKDGRRVGYLARRAGKKQFVIDGTPGPLYDEVHGLVFSDDGAHYGYLVKTRDADGRQVFFVVYDGKEGARYDLVAGLTMTADGRRWAYAAGRGGKQMLVANEVAYRPYDGLGDVAFSPDGRRLAITAETRVAEGDDRRRQWRAVVDGKEGPPFDGCGQLLFSADSRRVAYVAGRGRKQLAVIDGVPGDEYDGVGAVAFSPDGARVAYGAVAAGGGERVLVVDGRRFAPAGVMAFSPDGRRIAHAVPRAAGDPAPAAALPPSPDEPAGERWVLAVDNVVARDDAGAPAEYNGFPLGGRLVYDAAGAARVIAGRGKQMFRVELHAE